VGADCALDVVVVTDDDGGPAEAAVAGVKGGSDGSVQPTAPLGSVAGGGVDGVTSTALRSVQRGRSGVASARLGR
jgi:hypothetical protein